MKCDRRGRVTLFFAVRTPPRSIQRRKSVWWYRAEYSPLFIYCQTKNAPINIYIVLYELPQRLFLFYHVCWRPLQFWSFGFLFWIFGIKQYNKHKRVYGHTLYRTLLFSIISGAIDNCEYIFYTRSVVWLTPPRWSSSIVRWQWFARWDGRGVVT